MQKINFKEYEACRCGVNSSSFSHLLSFDLFGTELVAHTVNCITPELAAPPAWKWRGLLTCSYWHWGQRPGLCPETNRTLRKINKHTLILIYMYTYLRWMKKAEWVHEEVYCTCMDWPKRFSAGVFTGAIIPVTEALLSTGLTLLLHGP